MRITACRSCAAPCFWVETQKKLAMLMNRDPDPSGTFTVKEREDDVPLAIFVGTRVTELERYSSHFSTCRDAQRWRNSSGGPLREPETPTKEGG